MPTARVVEDALKQDAFAEAMVRPHMSIDRGCGRRSKVEDSCRCYD